MRCPFVCGLLPLLISSISTNTYLVKFILGVLIFTPNDKRPPRCERGACRTGYLMSSFLQVFSLTVASYASGNRVSRSS
jgi:hypothetical protein